MDTLEKQQELIDYNENNNELEQEKEFEQSLINRVAPEEPEKMEDLKKKLDQMSKIQGTSTTESKDKKHKAPTKKELEKMIKEQSDLITHQAEEIKKNNDFRPDFEYILKNEKFFKKFLDYDVNFVEDMNICDIMHSWTNFKYSPYGELRTNYIKRAGERVVIMEELGKIFNYNFMTYVSKQNYRFDSLNFELCKFIGGVNDNDKASTNFEYFFIRSMLVKLLICMFSYVDKCFSNKYVQININFKKAVQNYLNEFGHILKTNNKISRSWEVFEHNLFLSENDCRIFDFVNAQDLKEKIIECINIDNEKNAPQFMLEELVANSLKTFIPTIAYSYFMVIKDIYIIGRLLSIYANRNLYKNKTKEQIMEDLYIIASVMTIEYEVSYIANLNTRSTPVCRNGSELSKQTEMYYINHLIAGPQYFILKQLELSLPTISTTFIKE